MVKTGTRNFGTRPGGRIRLKRGPFADVRRVSSPGLSEGNNGERRWSVPFRKAGPQVAAKRIEKAREKYRHGDSTTGQFQECLDVKGDLRPQNEGKGGFMG